MKNLIINLSLISTLLIGQTALAQNPPDVRIATSVIEADKMETIVVMAKPEVANFEIYSTQITENAINSAMKLMTDSLATSVTDNAESLVRAAVKIGNSI